VSENDNCHCAGTTKVVVKVMGRNDSRGKPRGDVGKTDIEGADMTCWERLFQVRAAATGKARSPMVDSRWTLWGY